MRTWPASDGIRLIRQIEESVLDEKLYTRWCAFAQNVMTFEDYKRELKPKVFRPEDEIMADTEAILNSFGGSPHGDI